ncbi:MAG TPA: YeeE/YedE thiosulfate transporter family protein [Polyangiaceae bacterium]|nr:YeeE/YedE thiosulfate transporter family protein [Polyangiaceae bacterium]
MADPTLISSFSRALAGGALIGAAATIYWFRAGRVAGVSGVLAGALQPDDADRSTRVWFLVGLLVAGIAAAGISGAAPGPALPVAAVSGLLVGFGARLGGGCTSGHGVCGLGRFSLRSLVAVLTFMATGALTVWAVRHGAPSLGALR